MVAVLIWRALLAAGVLALFGAACDNTSERVEKFGTHHVSDVKRAVDSVARAAETPSSRKALRNACERLQYVSRSANLPYGNPANFEILSAVTQAADDCVYDCGASRSASLSSKLPWIRTQMADLRTDLASIPKELGT
jgi:hypothetical protein